LRFRTSGEGARLIAAASEAPPTFLDPGFDFRQARPLIHVAWREMSSLAPDADHVAGAGR